MVKSTGDLNFKRINVHANSGLAKRSNSSEGKIERYSLGKFIKVVLITPRNYTRILQVIGFLFVQGVLKLSFIFTSKIGFGKLSVKIKDQHTFVMKNKVVVLNRITHAWGKKIFGDRLKGTTVNIGKANVTKKQEEEGIKAALDVLKKDPTIARILDENPEIESNIRTFIIFGVCWGSSIEFIRDYLEAKKEDPSRSNILEDITVKLSKGADLVATIKHGIYLQLWNFKNQLGNQYGDWTMFRRGLVGLRLNQEKLGDVNCDKLMICTDILKKIYNNNETKDLITEMSEPYNSENKLINLINNNSSEEEIELTSDEVGYLSSMIEYIRFRKGKCTLSNESKERVRILFQSEWITSQRDLHEKIINLDNIQDSPDGTSRAALKEVDIDLGETVGLFELFDSTKEQIKDINDLPTGAYQISFTTGNGSHACVFIKEEGNTTLFDIYYGMIECGDQDPAEALLQLMYSYKPPNIPPGNDKKADPNYRFEIYGYELAKK